jgi:hypothetical protein
MQGWTSEFTAYKLTRAIQHVISIGLVLHARADAADATVVIDGVDQTAGVAGAQVIILDEARHDQAQHGHRDPHRDQHQLETYTWRKIRMIQRSGNLSWHQDMKCRRTKQMQSVQQRLFFSFSDAQPSCSSFWLSL